MSRRVWAECLRVRAGEGAGGESPKTRGGRRRAPGARWGWAASLCAAAALLAGAGCGSVGAPLPPLLNIPARTTDLEASERAAELLVHWTVPSQTTEGFPVKTLDRVVLLGMEAESNSVDPAAFEAGAHPIETLEEPTPGQRIDRRLPLPAAPGKRFALGIKNYSHRGRDAGLSNVVVVEISKPVAAPLALTATAQARAVRLDWPRVPGAWGYLIFRKTDAATQFESLGRIQFPPFDDPNFTWGAPYVYFVRAYAEVSTGIAESADSPQAAIVPKDIFPPSPPAGLRAVVSEVSVELSWDLSPEPDTAGYHVYRRDASGKNARLDTELLTAPVFSDKQVRPHEHYTYTVTAVDQNGNESAPSAPFPVTIP